MGIDCQICIEAFYDEPGTQWNDDPNYWPFVAGFDLHREYDLYLELFDELKDRPCLDLDQFEWATRQFLDGCSGVNVIDFNYAEKIERMAKRRGLTLDPLNWPAIMLYARHLRANGMRVRFVYGFC